MFGAIAAAALTSAIAGAQAEYRLWKASYDASPPHVQKLMLEQRARAQAEAKEERRHQEIVSAIKSRDSGGFAKGMFWGFLLGKW